MGSEFRVFPSQLLSLATECWLAEPKLARTARLRPLGYGAAAFVAARAKAGGADRDRTDDLKLAKLALSQLSYGPSAPGARKSEH